MIHVRAWGGTQEQRDYCRSIARWSAHHLLTDRMASSVSVNIALVKDLFYTKGSYGDCEPLDMDSRRPKEFKIRVDSSMKMRSLLTTVAHEMVHVKQFVKEEMKVLSERTSFIPMTKYHGKLYYDHMNYWEQPWEIEAHGWERGLFEMWGEAHEIFQTPSKHRWAFEDHYPRGYWKDKK